MQSNIIEEHQTYLERVGKSPNTVKAYINDLRAFMRWFHQTTGREFEPRAIDPRDITEYRGFLISRGRRPATVNRRLSALNRFFQWAKREIHIDHSPFEILERIHVKEQKDVAPNWLTRKDQLALIRSARQNGSRRDLAIIQIFLGTGLRISELTNLKISDSETNERSGWLRVREGKGGKARDIPLDRKTRHAITSYLKTREEDGSERLFLGQRGPINQSGIYYLVTKYAYQARLEDVTPHTLRHSFAKNLVDADVSLDQVATLLGHESVNTVRIYTRPCQEDLVRAVRRASGEVQL